jgi:hypothetical protein
MEWNIIQYGMEYSMEWNIIQYGIEYSMEYETVWDTSGPMASSVRST